MMARHMDLTANLQARWKIKACIAMVRIKNLVLRRCLLPWAVAPDPADPCDGPNVFIKPIHLATFPKGDVDWSTVDIGRALQMEQQRVLEELRAGQPSGAVPDEAPLVLPPGAASAAILEVYIHAGCAHRKTFSSVNLEFRLPPRFHEFGEVSDPGEPTTAAQLMTSLSRTPIVTVEEQIAAPVAVPGTHGTPHGSIRQVIVPCNGRGQFQVRQSDSVQNYSGSEIRLVGWVRSLHNMFQHFMYRSAAGSMPPPPATSDGVDDMGGSWYSSSLAMRSAPAAPIATGGSGLMGGGGGSTAVKGVTASDVM